MKISPSLKDRRPLDTLVLDDKNARKHNDAGVEIIAASLKQFGQQKPLVITADGRVVAGNGRLMAMRKLGWAEAAVKVINDDDAKAFAIADNRVAEFSVWNPSQLMAQATSLPAELLASTGFTLKQLQDTYGDWRQDIAHISELPVLVRPTIIRLEPDEWVLVDKVKALLGIHNADGNATAQHLCSKARPQ